MAPQKARAYALYTLSLIGLLWLWPVQVDATCTPLGGVTPQIGLCKPVAGETGWTDAINKNWDLIDTNVGTIPSGAIMFYGGNSPPTGWYVCDGSSKSRTTDASLYAIFGVTYGAGDGSTTFNLPDGRSRNIMLSGTGTFVSSTDFSNVNAGTDVITVPTNNSLYTGTLVTFSSTGTAPGGLTNGNPYYVINTSLTTIKLATSQANAVAGSQIDLTTQGSGTHTFTVAYSTRNLADLGGEETHASTSTEMPAHPHSLVTQATGGGATTVVSITASANTTTTTSGLVVGAGGSTGHNVISPFITFTCMVKR